MALTNICQFTTDPNSANAGKIVFKSQESVNLSPDYWTVYVKITDPTGVVIHTPPSFSSLGDYNVNGTTQTTWASIVIPKDSNGNYLAGNYLVEIWKRLVSDALPAAIKVANETYNFCPHNQPGNTLNSKLTFAETLSCVSGTLTETDKTDYATPGYTITSRLLIISPPLIDGRSPIATSTTTVSIVVDYTNVVYGIEDKVSYTYSPQVSQLDTNTSILSVAGIIRYIDYKINCNNDICGTLTCLGDYFEGLKAKACNGGWSNLTPAERANMEYATIMLNLANMKLACGDVVSYENYVNSVKDLLIDCGCGCSDCGSNPQPFVPLT